jgi:hypothetical protein
LPQSRRVDAVSSADVPDRIACAVSRRSLIDSAVGQRTERRSSSDAAALEVEQRSLPVDAESLSDDTNRRAGLIQGDQRIDLGRLEPSLHLARDWAVLTIKWMNLTRNLGHLITRETV